MQRRRFLAVCGAGLLAGCLDSSGATTPDSAGEPGSPGDTPGADETGSGGADETGSGGADDGPTVSVAVEKLQPAIVALNTDSLGVYSADRTQYLFLQLTVEDGEAPPRSELQFRFDGDHYDLFEGDSATDLWRLYDGAETRYEAERGAGWVCFPLPATGAPEGAGLVWDGGVWIAPPALRDRLAAEAPPLSVSWSAPDTVEVGQAPTMELSVTNEGERAGRFVGALNRTGPAVAYTPVAAPSRRIPAGESETWTLETSELGVPEEMMPEDGPTEATYHLHWPEGHEQRDVEVVPRE